MDESPFTDDERKAFERIRDRGHFTERERLALCFLIWLRFEDRIEDQRTYPLMVRLKE